MQVTPVSFDSNLNAFYVDLTWPDPRDGTSFACVTAINTQKLASDPHCLDICVGQYPTKLIAVEPNILAGNVTFPIQNLTLVFDGPVVAGVHQNHFKVLENAPPSSNFTTVFDEVIRDSELIRVLENNRVFVDLRGVPWRGNTYYKFEIDEGFAISQNCCGIYADIMGLGLGNNGNLILFVFDRL